MPLGQWLAFGWGTVILSAIERFYWKALNRRSHLHFDIFRFHSFPVRLIYLLHWVTLDLLSRVWSDSKSLGCSAAREHLLQCGYLVCVYFSAFDHYVMGQLRCINTEQTRLIFGPLHQQRVRVWERRWLRKWRTCDKRFIWNSCKWYRTALI